METTQTTSSNSFLEVNLKIIIKKIFKRKWFFAISVFLCCTIAYLYLKTLTSTYEVSATLLIDQQGKNSLLGDSKYIDGNVALIDQEKNLFNEKGILKSYSLIKQTVEDLDFGISYFSGTWYRKSESFGYFPFEVELIDSTSQMYGVLFQVEMISDNKFKFIAETKKFDVSNPANNTIREVEKNFEFSDTYSFGEEIRHNYFNFILKKPDYPVKLSDFEEQGLYFKLNSVEGLTKSFMGRLSVDQTDILGSIIRLKTTGKVVAKEKLFLSKLMENYIESKAIEREKIASKKEDFLLEQLEGISDSLAKAERKLEFFKKGANAVKLQQSATYALEQLQNLESNKGQIELNIKYYNSVLQYISDSSGIEKIIAPSVVGIDDPLLNENLLELKRLNSEKIRLKFFKGRMSYDLEVLEQQIANTTMALKENLKNLIQASQFALSDKTNQITSLEGTINQLPTNEKLLLNYERKSARFENFYNYLSQELAKTGIAKAETILDTKVLDEPRLKGKGPIAPQKKLIMALGFMVGSIIPFLWIVFFDPYDGEINDAEQIEAFTKIPVAASIAHFNSKPKKFESASANWQVEESFRDLCANLQISLPDPANNIIGVTSTVPGEGKTFCAINLGVNLAAQGKNTLLIESDIRNPNILRDMMDKKDGKLKLRDIKKNSLPNPNGIRKSKVNKEQTDNEKNNNGPSFEFEMNSSKKKGLLHYLKGNINLESVDDIIHPYEGRPNLFYIPAQQVGDENPHLLLSDDRMGQLINDLKNKFDYIVIDSPPVGLVSDYLLISRFIKINLFVVRRNVSKFSYLKNIEKVMKKGRMKNVFLIFNDVLGSSFKYGYASKYQYGKIVKKDGQSKK